MARPLSGMTGKCLEVQSAVSVTHELCPPGFEIVDHIDNVVDPHVREVGIDQLAAMLEDVLEMKLRIVIPAHGGCESSRATVVVPLVARPLVTWITATPASAHSNAAMVPAAPPPTINTSVR